MPIDAWFYEAFIMQSDGRILNEDETDIGFNNETGREPLAMWKNIMSEGIIDRRLQEKSTIPMKQPAQISPQVSLA